MPNENLSNLIISLQKEFKDFKGDLTGLKTEFKDFKSDFTGFKKEFKDFRDETDENFNEVYSKLDNHTAAIMSLEKTIGFYGDMYKMNKEKIDNHDKRISILEAKS
jgi:chromosome segregation ATPase